MDEMNIPLFLPEGKTEEEKAIIRKFNRVSHSLPDVTDLECLVTTGYLTEDEAEKFSERPKELPKDKKELIVNYVLYSGLVSMESLSSSFCREIQNSIKSYDLREMKANKSAFDVLGTRKCGELLQKLCEARVTESRKKVEAFVLSRRRRIREQLLKGMLLRIANELTLEPVNGEDGEILDGSPFLRERLNEYGYRENAKSLNDKDREALTHCASLFLDMLEVSLLNGVGDKRCEFYETLYDEDGYLMDEYHYIDDLDEVLFQYKDIYLIMRLLYEHAINELNISRIGSVSVKAAKSINRLAPEDMVIGRVSNSKFKEYTEGVTMEANEENLDKAFRGELG